MRREALARRSSRRGSRSRSRRASPLAAHHRDVHPRDRQDRCASRTARRDDRRRSRSPSRASRRAGMSGTMPGQERREMRLARDRTDARAAAAVRNAERLVQVEVRDVGAELARRGEADERIEVGAVDVHLAAVRVHDVADAHDARLEHAVRRRIRHHDRREIGRGAARPSPRDRRGRRCRRDRTRRRRPSCPPSAPTPGFVPCADAGIRQTSRCASPRLA